MTPTRTPDCNRNARASFAAPTGSASRPKLAGWWEEYRCGCVSKTVKRKKDLLGYCGKHGDSRRQVFPELLMPNDRGQR